MEPQGRTGAAVPVRRSEDPILNGMLDQHGGSAEASQHDRSRLPSASAEIGRDDRAPGQQVLAGLQAVVDRLPEAVLATDADGAVRLTNVAADRLFAGRPVQDAGDLLSRFEDAGVGQMQPVHQDDPPRRLTVRPLHQPNTWYALDRVPFEAAAAGPAPAGGGGTDERVGSVWVLRDVTDSADLHAEREAFLAVLSHELRTPLTTIYAGSSVLARRGHLSPPATRTLALDISAEAARLYDLVENLLVIARLERRILEPLDEPVDVGQALDAAIRTTHERFPDARIDRLGERRPPPVHGDTTYVEQACRNLLLAGLRAAGEDEDPRLAVRADVDERRREVCVRVFDRGPWLSEAELGQAFDLAGEAASARMEGTGLGPFVVRHIIDAMNGRTWARNRDDGGVEMGFALAIDDRS